MSKLLGKKQTRHVEESPLPPFWFITAFFLFFLFLAQLFFSSFFFSPLSHQSLSWMETKPCTVSLVALCFPG